MEVTVGPLSVIRSGTGLAGPSRAGAMAVRGAATALEDCLQAVGGVPWLSPGTRHPWSGSPVGRISCSALPRGDADLYPYFLRFGAAGRMIQYITYGAAYLGIASGAFALACAEGDKRFPSGGRRLDNPINQRRLAELSVHIEAARALLHTVAAMADAGRAPSVLPLLQAKVLCAEVGVRVTAELMTLFGGTAFAARLPFERYFRDARAGW